MRGQGTGFFLTKELRRPGVAVAGIQEAKWFGKDVWTSEDCVFLHSERLLPAEGDPARRNEGVGIWLIKKCRTRHVGRTEMEPCQLA